MKKTLLLLFFAMFIIHGCVFEDVDDGTQTLCTRIYQPVCGDDGYTYGNECEAGRAGVTIDYEGECS